MLACGGCGSKAEETDKFCMICGTTIEHVHEPSLMDMMAGVDAPLLSDIKPPDLRQEMMDAWGVDAVGVPIKNQEDYFKVKSERIVKITDDPRQIANARKLLNLRKDMMNALFDEKDQDLEETQRRLLSLADQWNYKGVVRDGDGDPDLPVWGVDGVDVNMPTYDGTATNSWGEPTVPPTDIETTTLEEVERPFPYHEIRKGFDRRSPPKPRQTPRKTEETPYITGGFNDGPLVWVLLIFGVILPMGLLFWLTT